MLRSEEDLENIWPRGWGELEWKGQLELVGIDDLTGRRFDLQIFDSYVLKETADSDFDNGDHMSVLVGNIVAVQKLTLDAVRKVLADLNPEKLVPKAE